MWHATYDLQKCNMGSKSMRKRNELRGQAGRQAGVAFARVSLIEGGKRGEGGECVAVGQLLPDEC